MRSIKPEKQRRQFFVLIGIALLTFGVWKTFKDQSSFANKLFYAATCVFVIEFFVPQLAKFLFSIWMAFAHALGKFQTRLLLTIVYFTMFVPIAFFRGLGKKKEKSTEEIAREKNSAWFPVSPLPEGSDHYYKQF